MKDARSHEIRLGNMLSQTLRDTTGFWVKRRTKDQLKMESQQLKKERDEGTSKTENEFNVSFS